MTTEEWIERESETVVALRKQLRETQVKLLAAEKERDEWAAGPLAHYKRAYEEIDAFVCDYESVERGRLITLQAIKNHYSDYEDLRKVLAPKAERGDNLAALWAAERLVSAAAAGQEPAK